MLLCPSMNDPEVNENTGVATALSGGDPESSMTLVGSGSSTDDTWTFEETGHSASAAALSGGAAELPVVPERGYSSPTTMCRYLPPVSGASSILL